jgi:hypothetical protein
MEKEAPTIYKMIVENAKELKNIRWRDLRIGDTWNTISEGLRNFFKTGDKNVL